MKRLIDFLTAHKFLSSSVTIAVFGVAYWSVQSYRFPDLDTCLERSSYACVARAAYKAMPTEKAAVRNHKIGMSLAFAGEVGLAHSTLKAEGYYWRKTRIAGAIIARHVMDNELGSIQSVLKRLQGSTQQAVALGEARSFLRGADVEVVERLRAYVLSFTKELTSTHSDAVLLETDEHAGMSTFERLLSAVHPGVDKEPEAIVAGISDVSIKEKVRTLLDKRIARHEQYVGTKVIRLVHRGGAQDEIVKLLREDMEVERSRNPRVFEDRTIRFISLDIGDRKDSTAAKGFASAVEKIAETIENITCRAQLYNRLAKMYARIGELSQARRLVDRSLELELPIIDNSGIYCSGGGEAYTLAMSAVLGRTDALGTLKSRAEKLIGSGELETADEAGRSLIFALNLLSGSVPFETRERIANISLVFQEAKHRARAGKAELSAIGLTQASADIKLWFGLASSARKKYQSSGQPYHEYFDRLLLEWMTEGYDMSRGWITHIGRRS